MTKEEIKKFLSETKVYVNGKSAEIQKKLFSLGYLWFGDDAPKIFCIKRPFIFLDDKMRISCSDDMLYFAEHKYREITDKEILSLELSESYRPFKSQEECWNEMMKHQPFGWIKNEAGNIFNIIAVFSDAIKVNEHHTNYSELCEGFKFMDGTPFGIKGE